MDDLFGDKLGSADLSGATKDFMASRGLKPISGPSNAAVVPLKVVF